jgi:hypothetical protein
MPFGPPRCLHHTGYQLAVHRDRAYTPSLPSSASGRRLPVKDGLFRFRRERSPENLKILMTACAGRPLKVRLKRGRMMALR